MARRASAIGGTGASGIPSISRYLRERFRDHADRFVLSSVLMLPYFDVPPSAADETMEIVVKSSAFLDKARTALQYYGMEGMIRSGENDPNGVYDAHCSLWVGVAASGNITGWPRPYQKPAMANTPSKQARR